MRISSINCTFFHTIFQITNWILPMITILKFHQRKRCHLAKYSLGQYTSGPALGKTMALLSLYTTYWINKMTTAKPQCYLQCFVVVCCIELCPDRLYIVYLSQIIHQWPQFGLNELRQFIINWSCLCKRTKWMKMKK